MMKQYFAIFFLLVGSYVSAQTTVTIYSTGTAGSFITGRTTATTRTSGGIKSSDVPTSIRGYAVFDLSSIPTGALISSCVIGLNISGYTGSGIPSGWVTNGFAGDLSTVTTASALYSDCGSGTLLSNTSYGTATGNITIPSSDASDTLIAQNTGSTVSICFTGGASRIYSFTGSTGASSTTGTHAPYLQITYCTTPNAGSISGTPSICLGSTNAFTTTSDTGGLWSTTDGTVSVDGSGNVTALSAGSATISYIVSNACGADTATFGITVMDTVMAGFISGPFSLCPGSTANLTASGTTGGIWSSSAEATIDAATGHLIAVSAGTANVTYTVTGTCNTNSAYYSVTIYALPDAGVISGSSNICTGSSTLLTTSSTSGGTWIADGIFTSVDASGNVTGLSSGTGIVSFTVHSITCGADTATYTVTVTNPANAGTITGAASVCQGSSTALATSGDAGGTWTSSAAGVINSVTGSLTGLSAGTASIDYTVTDACSTDVATYSVIVNPLPNAGTISGTTSICTGSTSLLTSSGDIGGSWTTTDAAASVDASGNVTGISAGTAAITYSVTNGCGTNFSITTVTVSDAVTAGVISGTATICEGGTTNLSTTGTTGGTWTVDAHATVDATGTVTGTTAGTANITYSVIGCNRDNAYYAVTVNPLPHAGTISGTTTLCTGSSSALTSSGDPLGTWTTTDAAASVDVSGNVTAIATGTAVITYSVTNSCGTDFTTTTVSVSNALTAGTISGTGASICPGDVTTLTTSGDAGGTWTSSAQASVDASGNVTGVSGGTANITYTVTGCNTDAAFYSVTVNPRADSGTISGTSIVCLGLSVSLSETVTGGTWSSTPEASVDASGLVTGLSTGIATISYTVNNICGNTSATYAVTVTNALAPDAGIISGPANVCQTASIALSETVSAGTWSSTAEASVDASGNVTGIAAGLATISYTVTTGCGTAFATYPVTVDASPNAGVISGSTNVCPGSAILLSTTGDTGGSWSASNGNATVDSSGNVNGVTTGAVTISYTATTATCGSATSIYNISVNPLPDAGAISGPSSLCQGGSSILPSSTVSGGSWSGDAFASVDASGNVTGISSGVSLISYTVFSALCGSATATYPVTVNPAANAGTISGSHAICNSFTSPLTDAGASDPGVWSSNDNAIASVDAGGNVTGNSIGSTTITYTVTNGCGTAFTTFAVSVSSGAIPTAGTITGATHVCIGSDIILDDATATAGGTWSSSNIAIADVDASGDVFALSQGAVTISYIISTGCNSDTATFGVTVDNVPNGGAVNGLNNVCVGSPFTLTDPTGDLGGVWSSSNITVATISVSGAVTSLSTGTTTISYMVSNTCGTSTATYPVTVNPTPAGGTITGSATVCEGVVTTLSDATGTPGGTWTSSSTANATVDASGNVTGVLAGSTTISYTFTNVCGTATTTFPLTVNPQPVAGTISGPVTVCEGAFISLSDATGTAGGTWSSSDITKATVDVSGNVTAILAGTPVISYTTTTVCGSASATYTITVNPLPNAGTITGSSTICVGATAALANPTALAGGTWSSSAPGNVSVDASGNITGILTGGGVITYLSSTACGVAATTFGITVSPLPVAGSVTGDATLCTGASSDFADPALLGVWSSDNSSVATVDVTGTVTGVAAGTATISYAVTNGCGTVAATSAITINPAPSAGAITGIIANCVGTATSLSDIVGGGTWTSSDNTIATVSASGNVTAIAAGGVTISYTVTNSFGCSGVATNSGSVYAVPVLSPISGSHSVCIGSSLVLTDTATYGTWSSSDNTIATVDALGNVTGVTAGTATITYFETNPGGCSAFATFSVVAGGSFPSTFLLPLGSATICDSAVHMSVVSADTTLSYQWYINGIAIVGDTASNYYIDTPGVYTVVASQGCLSETLPPVTILAPPAPVISLSGVNLLFTGSYSSYQWYLDSVAIPGAVSSVHVAATPGVYIVAVTDGNGCTKMSAPDTLHTVGVQNVVPTGKSIRVYPNPATATVHIDASMKVDVTVLTTLGKVAISKKDATDIDISNLANGMYMIMIYDENDHLLQSDKLIKSE